MVDDKQKRAVTAVSTQLTSIIQSIKEPNQDIVNDLLELVSALADESDDNYDEKRVKQTTSILLEELTKGYNIPQQKIDTLIETIIDVTRPQEKTVVEEPVKKEEKQQAQPKPDNKPAIDDSMVKLIMEEVQEVIKRQKKAENDAEELRNSLSGKTTNLTEDLESLRSDIKTINAEIKKINKNMDKFVSLYELVINQYNPFVEKSKKPVLTDSKGNQIEHVHDLIALVPTIENILDLKPKVAEWVKYYLKDTKLAHEIEEMTTKKQMVAALSQHIHD